MSDDELIESLVQAAEAAIRNERPGLIYDRARLRGIHVELGISNGGNQIRGTCYIDRVAHLGRILGREVPLPVEGETHE